MRQAVAQAAHQSGADMELLHRMAARLGLSNGA